MDKGGKELMHEGGKGVRRVNESRRLSGGGVAKEAGSDARGWMKAGGYEVGAIVFRVSRTEE